MPLVPAKCTQCGANITVDDSKDAAICEFCGTAFITEKVINNYNVTNNFNIANAQITVSGIDVTKRIDAAEKLMNSGLFDEGKRMLFQITEDCPEDYRAYFLLAKYAYQFNDLWFDDNPQFQKAKALADDNGLADITKYYNEMHTRILNDSKSVVDFCEGPDYSKLYYCYLKWYYSSTFNESDKIPSFAGYGYWGFEPVDGHPAMVSYTKNNDYGYVRRIIATDCKVVTHLHKKKLIGVIISDNKCVWLPQHVRNEFGINWGDGVDLSSRYETCRIFITDFRGGKVIYNNNPSEMLYGDTLQSQSTDFKETSGGCYVATSVYGSYDCPQVWTLRRFRDNTLAGTWYGRAFIRMYYAISPKVVKWLGQTEWFKNIGKHILDRMVEKLHKSGVECSPYDDREW